MVVGFRLDQAYGGIGNALPMPSNCHPFAIPLWSPDFKMRPKPEFADWQG
jgi:hypothetical protein